MHIRQKRERERDLHSIYACIVCQNHRDKLNLQLITLRKDHPFTLNIPRGHHLFHYVFILLLISCNRQGNTEKKSFYSSWSLSHVQYLNFCSNPWLCIPPFSVASFINMLQPSAILKACVYTVFNVYGLERRLFGVRGFIKLHYTENSEASKRFCRRIRVCTKIPFVCLPALILVVACLRLVDFTCHLK